MPDPPAVDVGRDTPPLRVAPPAGAPRAAGPPGAAPGAVPDDAALIARSLRDGREFVGLYDRHAAAVRGYLVRRMGLDTADDLLAQTFLVAFENRHRFDDHRPSARPWLFGIATMLVRRHRRDEIRGYRALGRAAARDEGVGHDHADTVIAGADARAQTERVAAALARLPRGERDVLLLSAWGDLGYVEIAEALSLPVGTVKSRLSRARTRLRPLLLDGAHAPVEARAAHPAPTHRSRTR